MRTDPRADQVRMLVRRVFRELARHPSHASPHTLHKADHERHEGFQKADHERHETRGNFQEADHEIHETHENFEETDDETPENFRVFRGPSPPACPLLSAELAETVLVRQGRQVARSYRAEGYLATWRVELGIVEFYDAEGRILLTVNLFESLAGQRMAA